MNEIIDRSAECCVLSAEEKTVQSVQLRTQNSALRTNPITQHSGLSTQHLLPLPELPITVRLGTNDDIPFIDGLQKKHNNSLGFMFKGALEGKIKREEILIAEEVVSGQCLVVSAEEKDTGGVPTVAPNPSDLTTNHYPLTTRVGYLIGNDRYQKRDELGCIFQLCVEPGKRRGLVGATLLKALFERASYGCKLYCCWCAQDLEANYFWEAMGFVPVAFRSGAKKKLKGADGKRTDRVHIFWQKRIRAGDTETPWWYPHETGGGAIGEDRIVLPIPPTMHWSEVRSVVVPGEDRRAECCVLSAEGEQKLLSTQNSELSTDPTLSTQDSTLSTDPNSPKPKRERKSTQHSALSTQNSKKEPYTLRCQAIYFAPPVVEKPKAEKVKKEKPPKEKKKNDPEKVKAARYLRDRYTEEINRGDYLVSNGKYDVSRLIENVALPKGAVPVDQKLLAA